MRIPLSPIQRTVDPGISGGVALARAPQQNGLQDIGRALGDVAQLRERNAAIDQENFQRLEHEQMKARVIDRSRDDRLKWTQRLEDLKNSAAPGAEGFTPSVMKELDGYREQALKGVKDDNERRMYDGMLGQLRESVGEHAVVFESTARRSFRTQTLTEGVDKSARVLAIDPSQFHDVLAQEMASINGSTDLPAKDKAVLADKARDLLAYTAAKRMVTDNPDSWLAASRSQETAAAHPILPHLAPERISALNDHAHALVDQRNAKAEHLLDKTLRDAEQATDELRKFWIAGGVPDMGYIETVQLRTRGTPYEGAAAAMIQQAQAGASHGASTIPRQEASIRSMESTLAAGSNPEAEKTLAYARQVTDTQKREYKENPFAAAARFQKLPSVPDAPLPNADAVPQYVAQVLPLLNSIEAASGKPVSPLQPAQAQKFSEQLKALPPAQRATVLGQTGEMLNAPRIGALAEQLDKHDRPLALALKMGAGRTTLDRAVQETMLRGADALRDKTVKRDDTALTGWRSEIASMVRGTLGDAQAEQDVIDAAYYTRAGMDEPGYPGKVGNETAVKLVIGQPLERGGVKTILPKGMDEGAFTEKVRSYTPDRLKEMAPAGEVYVRGQKRTLDQLSSSLPGMGMRRNGAGLYAPVSGGAMVTLDKDGQMPLLIEVK